ncbi:MAG TPA: phosphotransferase [Pyrinomonadaceae bacterium]|nr:phosphotransferase [Pyrinomonadaceae bacterium]
MSFPLISSSEGFDRHFRDEFWQGFARTICGRHGIVEDDLRRSPYGENVVFLAGESYVVKIYTPFRRGFAREKAALEFLRGKTSLKVPQIAAAGNIENYDYLVMTQLRGDAMAWKEWQKSDRREQAALAAKIGAALKELHSHNAGEIAFDWNAFLRHQIATVLERQRAAGANPEWLESLPRYLEENLHLLPEAPSPVFLHGDVHFGNLRMKKEKDEWVVTGLFDFADSLTGFHEYEFVAPGVLVMQGLGEVQREFLRAYGYADKDIDETLRRRLMLLTILYECSDLRKYALRLRPEAMNFTLGELEKAIWPFSR